MNNMYNRMAEFPRHQVEITPSDSDLLKTDMIIECGSAGAIHVVDAYGNDILRNVTTGYILPVLVAKVLSTGTTVDPVIGLY